MVRKLSIMAVVAGVLMIPTTLTAQMGGGVNPGVHVGGTVRGAVEQGIPGPDMGTWRSPSRQVHRTRKRSVRTSSADDATLRLGELRQMLRRSSSAVATRREGQGRSR